MKNIDMKVEGTILTITVDLSKEFGASSTGKSMTIASTEGNQSIPNFEGIKLGLNCYYKAGQDNPAKPAPAAPVTPADKPAKAPKPAPKK